MVTARDLKVAARVWERPFLDVLDPRAIDAERHFVFGFASGRAGVTANALAVVNEEAVAGRMGCHLKIGHDEPRASSCSAAILL
jgi:hypothetical protein